MGLERFFVLIQLSIASLSYEYPSVGEWTQFILNYTTTYIHAKSVNTDDELLLLCSVYIYKLCYQERLILCLPAAMTGSLISSLVIGQRNSSGMPEHTDSFFSSSTFLRSLLRRPTDSTERMRKCDGRERAPIKTLRALIGNRNQPASTETRGTYFCVELFSLLDVKWGWEWTWWKESMSADYWGYFNLNVVLLTLLKEPDCWRNNLRFTKWCHHISSKLQLNTNTNSLIILQLDYDLYDRNSWCRYHLCPQGPPESTQMISMLLLRQNEHFHISNLSSTSMMTR